MVIRRAFSTLMVAKVIMMEQPLLWIPEKPILEVFDCLPCSRNNWVDDVYPSQMVLKIKEQGQRAYPKFHENCQIFNLFYLKTQNKRLF